jgi:hypothetical protein
MLGCHAHQQEVLGSQGAAAAQLPVFPRSLTLGSVPEDLLVPPEQYSLLEGILDGQDVVLSARLDR